MVIRTNTAKHALTPSMRENVGGFLRVPGRGSRGACKGPGLLFRMPFAHQGGSGSAAYYGAIPRVAETADCGWAHAPRFAPSSTGPGKRGWPVVYLGFHLWGLAGSARSVSRRVGQKWETMEGSCRRT